jgi:serine/threonine protein kinase
MQSEFTFPENKAVYNGTIKDFTIERSFINFTDIDVLNPINNLINIDSTDYYFTYLSTTNSYNKGGNSIILKLYESQSFDIESIEYGTPDKIIKILKVPNKKYIGKPTKRFLKEIEALEKCQDKNFQNVINIYNNGICKVFDPYKRKYNNHQYYTMEFAKYDLKNFIELEHKNLSFEEKIGLCLSLAEGLKELESLGYYHRDIKPDNIFMVGKDEWKIGDLGLLDERENDAKIDDIAEAIGPKGWMSPESMNKYLCEDKGFSFSHNCKIDHQSDIFQLGKVFWYIFQHNAPIGTVKESDFFISNSSVFSIIKTMLNHSKKKRYQNIDEVIKLLKPLEAKALKIAI